MHYPFLEPLEEVLKQTFDFFDYSYITDKGDDVLRELEKRISSEYETRYVLIDGKTGQLESRASYESYDKAEKATELLGQESLRIGTLLVATSRKVS